MKRKIILVIVAITITLIAVGCIDSKNIQEVQEVQEVKEIESTNKLDNNITEILEIEGYPELKIQAVTIFRDSGIMEICVQNTGNAIAEDVYCGIILYGASNELAFSEYMTLKELKKIMAPSIKEGATGNVHEYETKYRYKDTPNLIITYKFTSIDYIGDILAEKTGIGHISIPSGTRRSTYMKVAWMDGLEDEFVIY